MRRTNFDRYLAQQLGDPAFAARFKRAGKAWDVAPKIAALLENGYAIRYDGGTRRNEAETAAPVTQLFRVHSCPLRLGEN